MQPTKKYPEIFGEGEKASAGSPANGSHSQQPSQVQSTRDFDVIATEVRAIITKAYEADEPNNIQS